MTNRTLGTIIVPALYKDPQTHLAIGRKSGKARNNNNNIEVVGRLHSSAGLWDLCAKTGSSRQLHGQGKMDNGAVLPDPGKTHILLTNVGQFLDCLK